MEAGRELDALVAEKVVGWKHEMHSGLGRLVWKSPPDFDTTWSDEPKPYSTDIGAAWEVLEKIGRSDDDPYFGLVWMDEKQMWSCHFGKTVPRGIYSRTQMFGKTAPLAICLAALEALKAVGK